MTKTYYDFIDELKAARGSNAKKAILVDAMKNEDFRTFARMCYDYSIVFGVRSVNKTRIDTGSEFKNETILKDVADFLVNNTKRSGEIVAKLEQLMSTANPAELPYLYLLLERNMKAGVNRGLIDKVEPGFIKPFLCGLAVPFNAKKLLFPCFAEGKLDGMRVIAFVDSNNYEVEYKSRNGKELDLPFFDEELLDAAQGESMVFDGELDSKDFDSVMEQARRKTNQDLSECKFKIFDMMPRADWNSRKTAIYTIRKAALHKALDGMDFERIEVVLEFVVNDQKELDVVYESFLEAGLEGAVMKQDAPYEFKRAKAWMKYKPTDTWDGEITGAYLGSGKNAHRLGGFNVEIDGVVTNVGGGYSDKQRDEFWTNRESYIGKFVEVEGQNLTKDGKVRFPEFVGFRPDMD